MPTLFDITLWIHILCGFIALFVAPGAMITRKGSHWHRRWGQTFFWAMAVVALTAAVMSLMRSGLFLLLVGLFSFYLAFTGYRVLYRKRPQQPASVIDWSAALLALLGSLLLLGYGLALLVGSQSMGLVACVFGVLGAGLTGADVVRFVRPPKDKRAWWFLHMTRMLAAYIATLSAFSVVNLTFLPPVVRWLWPTVVGSVGIALWVRHYKLQFGKHAVPRTTSPRHANVPSSPVQPHNAH